MVLESIRVELDLSCFLLAFETVESDSRANKRSAFAGRQINSPPAHQSARISQWRPLNSIVGFMRPSRLASFEPDRLWQLAREPIFWLDPMLKIVWVNRAWEHLTGHPASSVVGVTCHAHGPTRVNDLNDLAASFHPPPESLNGQPAGTLSLILHADGSGDVAPPRILAFSGRTRVLGRNSRAGAINR